MESLAIFLSGILGSVMIVHGGHLALADKLLKLMSEAREGWQETLEGWGKSIAVNIALRQRLEQYEPKERKDSGSRKVIN